MITTLYIILYLILALIVILSIFLTVTLIMLFVTKGVPYVPLSRNKCSALKQLIKLPPDARIVDLGCGDGRVLRVFESMGYKKLVGYEINLWPYVKGCVINFFKKSQVKLYLGNFLKVDLSKYDVIFCYLLPHMLKRLTKKFDAELKPGAVIISAAFEIKDWRRPAEILFPDQSKPMNNRFYIYKI
jgi:SAM-dependent methyltransferase